MSTPNPAPPSDLPPIGSSAGPTSASPPVPPIGINIVGEVRLTIPLEPRLHAYLEAVSALRLQTPDGYVLDLIERDLEARREKDLARLEKLMEEGMDSGPATPMTSDDWLDLKQNLLRKFGPSSEDTSAGEDREDNRGGRRDERVERRQDSGRVA